jgi:hypothetical protein
MLLSHDSANASPLRSPVAAMSTNAEWYRDTSATFNTVALTLVADIAEREISARLALRDEHHGWLAVVGPVLDGVEDHVIRRVDFSQRGQHVVLGVGEIERH